MAAGRRYRAATLFLALLLAAAPAAYGADNSAVPSPDRDKPYFEEESGPAQTVADPIEPFNRAMYTFNDKAYYWLFKPVARGYNYVVPEGARVSIRNFFSNLATPVRLVNNLLQGNLRASGTELARFAINSTTGILGLFDTARDNWHIRKRDADLGQTLGKYGLGQGMYIVLPVIGPTTARDGVGLAGDLFLDPVTYVSPTAAAVGIDAYRMENGLSLRLGTYEELTASAIDPYAAVRDAYLQHRASLVEKQTPPSP